MMEQILNVLYAEDLTPYELLLDVMILYKKNSLIFDLEIFCDAILKLEGVELIIIRNTVNKDHTASTTFSKDKVRTKEQKG